MDIGSQVRLLTELIEHQNKRIKILENRIAESEQENKELRRRLKQDSSNSGKPPSSDSIFKRSTRISKKGGSSKKPGGQQGHKGNKLKRFEQVDSVQEHCFEQCPHCQGEELSVVRKISRQILDIPVPRLEATDHIFYEYKCAICKELVKDPKMDELKQQVQYGPNIKSLVNYLNVYQIIPYKRLTELIEVIYGHKISQGSISNFNKEASFKLSTFIHGVKQKLRGEKAIVHADETGCMVSKQLSWVHVYSNEMVTLLEGSSYRGKKAMDEINILPQMKGTVIHDRWSSYFQYEDVRHGLCNAHLLRNIKAVQENSNMGWLEEIKQVLLRAKEEGKLKKKSRQYRRSKFENILRKQRAHYQKQDEILRKQKDKGPLKRGPEHRLFIALWKYRREILLFLDDEKVPFDNNQAERDLRMLKVKMKVSNQFKSMEWLNVHTAIRSFISTAQKQKLNLFQCLKYLHANPISDSLMTV